MGALAVVEWAAERTVEEQAGASETVEGRVTVDQA